MSYNIDDNNLKENIIIKKATDINSFTFNLFTKNVLPQLLKDNSIAFYDKKGNSKVFNFEIPVMYDANGNISNVNRLRKTTLKTDRFMPGSESSKDLERFKKNQKDP